MHFLTYCLFILFAYPLSWLPLNLLYALCGPLKFFLQSVFSYRKKVVITNLQNAFPEKTKGQIDQLASDFYRFLAELVIENIKFFSISQSEIHRMVTLKNPEVLHNFLAENKQIILVVGHFGNWELGSLILPMELNVPVKVIFKQQRNHWIGKLLNRVRSSTGSKMLEMNQVPREMLADKHRPNITVFLADQNPLNQWAAYTSELFGQKVYVYPGPEKMARKTGAVVVYGAMKRVDRGQIGRASCRERV